MGRMRLFKKRRRKIRGWHVRPKEVRFVDGVYIGVGHKDWVRFRPNPGYSLRGKHWCKKYGSHGLPEQVI